jgi:signal transduction histidine kinase
MNILANAIDAMEEERKVNEKEIRISTQVVNDLAVIRIKDNGVGMSEEIRNHLFETFFTTKPEGKGTGLGLSISYQIVAQKHGGKLTCTSAPGEGAEFAIAIPWH